MLRLYTKARRAATWVADRRVEYATRLERTSRRRGQPKPLGALPPQFRGDPGRPGPRLPATEPAGVAPPGPPASPLAAVGWPLVPATPTGGAPPAGATDRLAGMPLDGSPLAATPGGTLPATPPGAMLPATPPGAM